MPDEEKKPRKIVMPVEFPPRRLAHRDPKTGKEFYMMAMTQASFDACTADGWYEPAEVNPVTPSPQARARIKQFMGS